MPRLTHKLENLLLSAIERSFLISYRQATNPQKVAVSVPERVVHGLERAVRWSDALTPPVTLRRWVGPFTDPRVYRAVGDAAFRKLAARCDLRPDDDVLDVGCGCGQMAAPFARFLDARGSYQGFDIEPNVIEWCRRTITPRFPNFRFQFADVYNELFNQKGPVKGSEFVFPYPDESFDFIFAKSVFTHLLPDDAKNYVREIRRVLRTGGRAWISFFLLEEESRRLVAEGRSSLPFRFAHGVYHVNNAEAPEQAVAYDEPFVLDLFDRDRLVRDGSIERGSWCGRPAESYQDAILAVKR